MVLGVSISRKKLSRKYVFHSERQWKLPKGVKAKDPGLQPFARSGRHFLLYLAHFIEAFLPQFLSHYERSFRGFYFDFYFLERLVASFNLTLLLLFENYNLKGRPRWVLVPNEDYDPTLPKETEPFKYKELKLKYWRRRLQPPKLPNEPMVIVKENSGQRRYLAGVRSFRIVEISAFNRNINFCMFGVKFFYKPPRKAIPLFIFSYFWINFRDFLILRTYFYHSYAQRYNELVAYVLGSRHYMRYPLVRPSRSFYFHHINIYHFYLVQFAIFFYFGHMIFLHVYQHPYVERKDPVLLYKGYKFYNKFFAILPLLRNPELWTMRRPLTKDTRYSVFF
jgi:hypothetical protein